MATLPQSQQPTTAPFRHYYNATAGILSAKIDQPVRKAVETEVVKLSEDGVHQFRPAQPFRVDGIVSYDSGYTKVAGFANASGGATTVAISVVEGLNILDVITADRVVGQITTEHPADGKGQVPSVSFLGTRFDNLRINGQPVDVTRCLDILGPKPAEDKSYLEDEVVRWKLSEQRKGLPAWVTDRWNNAAIQDISQPSESTAHCSLVSKVEGAQIVSFGHAIDLPHFGKLFLAELRVNRKKAKNDPSKPPQNDTYSFHLNMIKAELKGIATGDIDIAPCDSNGQGSSGGGHGG